MGTVFDLCAAAGEQYGSGFSEEEYQLALLAARRKLARINELYGTHHGEPYLAALIVEAVQARRLAQCLRSAWDLREGAVLG